MAVIYYAHGIAYIRRVVGVLLHNDNYVVWNALFFAELKLWHCLKLHFIFNYVSAVWTTHDSEQIAFISQQNILK